MPPRSRQEFISPEGIIYMALLVHAHCFFQGLRLDGRRVNELRSLSAEMGVSEGFEGSASFAFGSTKVLATVQGPREISAAGDSSSAELGSIVVKIHAASFSSSGGERASGGANRRPPQDRRLQEWSRFVEEMLISGDCVMLEAFPRSQVDIFVEVLNADGGVLAAIVNAVCLALLDAGIPMREYLLACEVVHLQAQALLDPNRLEKNSIGPTVTAAFLPRSGRISFMLTEHRLGCDTLATVTRLLQQGTAKIFEYVDQSVVRPHLLALLESKFKK